MKKRLLALVLCLVMVTSLLPVTAFALTNDDIIGIKDQGIYCVDTYFTLAPSVASSACVVKDGDSGVKISPDINGRYSLPRDPGPHRIEFLYDDNGIMTRGLNVNILNHDWQFTKTENSLTATCRNPEQYKNSGGCKCPIGEVSLTLDARSVTLPDNPFNARLEGKEQFETATGAVISKIRYDYKGSDGVWHKGVDPVSANAKAGEYQAFVQISNLPRPVESDGVVAMAENPDGTYTADLYAQYTAADPAITAQTGDNRPIELMMASVLVFSALAAAAFILDSKRRSQQ